MAKHNVPPKTQEIAIACYIRGIMAVLKEMPAHDSMICAYAAISAEFETLVNQNNPFTSDANN